MELCDEIQKCFPQLQQHLGEHGMAQFRRCAYANLWQCHFGLGLWVRNHLLAQNSRLRAMFQKGGVLQLDDMSAFIIQLFYIALQTESSEHP